MKAILKASVALLAIPFSLSAQNKYEYNVDIKNVVDDKVQVILRTPVIDQEEVIFSFPKVIPGSYSEKNYGKYIEGFTALDKDGKKLKISKINPNQYKISNAKSLNLLQYSVNDTWDEKTNGFIFQPGGSNIEANKNVVINNFAFFGYFEGYRMLPFELKVTKPEQFYAATHLEVDRSKKEIDVINAKDFVYLADNPIIYSIPDTTSFLVGKSRINVAVYSANNKVKSAQIAEYLKPMAIALEKFFNGFPVKSYQFLYYFEDPKKALVGKELGGYGALEHNYSSLYFLPEIELEKELKSLVCDVSSHEFLHILTPLNLHSTEIENFDFTAPKMSQHLWLYEGVTEYFSNLVQVQNGLITEEQFFKNMRDKMNQAEEFGDFSMTIMSENVLDKKYNPKYQSVYNKGALIALMLDVCIREKTGNQKDLKNVIQFLAGKYGPSKPFNDADLFDEIVNYTHPDVRNFMEDYLNIGQPLPYKEYFSKLNYDYNKLDTVEAFYPGKMSLKYQNNNFLFASVEQNALGIKENDTFVKINGINVSEANIDDVWTDYFRLNTKYPELTIVVNRDGKEKELSGKIYTGYMKIKNNLNPSFSPTDKGANLLKLLLKKG